jgi:hypothetical protein
MSVTADRVITRYIELRDAKEALAKEHKAAMAEITAPMDKLETWLMDHLTKQGTTQTKGTKGTAFIKDVSSATVEDREAFFDYAINKGHRELLDVRCSKTVVDEYVEEHGTPPPGVKYSKAAIVQIRRA